MAGQMTKQKASSMMSRVQDLIDRAVPPETRQELVTNGRNFAMEQPLLAVSRLYTAIQPVEGS